MTSPGRSRIKPTGASSRRWPDGWGSASTALSSNLDRYGNTVGGTIPIALSEWNEQRRFTYGDRLVLSAFGAGFTSGSVYLRWTIA